MKYIFVDEVYWVESNSNTEILKWQLDGAINTLPLYDDGDGDGDGDDGDGDDKEDGDEDADEKHLGGGPTTPTVSDKELFPK